MHVGLCINAMSLFCRFEVGRRTFSKNIFDFVSYLVILEDNRQLLIVLVPWPSLCIHMLEYLKRRFKV